MLPRAALMSKFSNALIWCCILSIFECVVCLTVCRFKIRGAIVICAIIINFVRNLVWMCCLPMKSKDTLLSGVVLWCHRPLKVFNGHIYVQNNSPVPWELHTLRSINTSSAHRITLTSTLQYTLELFLN